LFPKSKKKQKSKPVAESSDSDVSVTYNDEDLDVSDIENLNLTVERYVIHKYENTYYPGECVVLKKISCIFLSLGTRLTTVLYSYYFNITFSGVIMKSDAEGAQIRSMVTAGLMDSWKWPVKDCIILKGI
jgi:hypothetical protein